VRKGEVNLPSLCTVRTLARLGNVSRPTSTQRRHEWGARRVHARRGLLIPLAEIEKEISLSFPGLQLVTSTRRQREEGNRQG
jgi:hypothetical protein